MRGEEGTLRVREKLLKNVKGKRGKRGKEEWRGEGREDEV